MANKLHPTLFKGNNLIKCRRFMHKYPIYEPLMYRKGLNAKRFMIPASRVKCVIRTHAWRSLESHRVRRVLRQKRLIKRRLKNVRLWSKLLVSRYKKMGKSEEYEELELYRVAEPLTNCSSAEMPEESERAVPRSSKRKMAVASAAATTASATIPSPVPNTRCHVSLHRLKDISNLTTSSLVGKPVVIDKEPQDPAVADSNTDQANRADYSFQRQSKKLEAKKKDKDKKLKTKVSESENTKPDMAKTKTKGVRKEVVKPSGSFLQMSNDLNTISTYYSLRPDMCRRAVSVPKYSYQRLNRRRVERVLQDKARQETSETEELLQRNIDKQKERERGNNKTPERDDSEESEDLSFPLKMSATEPPKKRLKFQSEEQESLETRALVQQESLEAKELLQSHITVEIATCSREIYTQQEQEQGNTLPIIQLLSNVELRYLNHYDVYELQIPELYSFDHNWLVLDICDDFSHILVPACENMISVTRIHTFMQMADESQKVVKLQFFPNSPYDAFVTPSSKRKIYFGPLPLGMPLPVILLTQMVDGKMMTREVYQNEYSIPVQLHSRSMAFVVMLVNGQVCYNLDTKSVAKLEAAQALPEMEIPSLAALSPEELCQSQANPLDTEVADSPPCLANDVTNDPNDPEPATTILQYLTQFNQSLPEFRSDTSYRPPAKISRPSMPLAKINPSLKGVLSSGNVETPGEITITKLDGSTGQRERHNNEAVKINSKRSMSESPAPAIPADSVFNKPAIPKAKVGRKPQQPSLHKQSAVKAKPIPSASVIKKPAIPIIKIVPSVRELQKQPLGAVLADGKPIGSDPRPNTPAQSQAATSQPPPFIAAVVAGWPNEIVIIYPPPRVGNA